MGRDLQAACEALRSQCRNAQRGIHRIGQTGALVQARGKDSSQLSSLQQLIEFTQPGPRSLGQQMQETPLPAFPIAAGQACGNPAPQTRQTFLARLTNGGPGAPDGKGDDAQDLAACQAQGRNRQGLCRGGLIGDAGFHPQPCRGSRSQQRGKGRGSGDALAPMRSRGDRWQIPPPAEETLRIKIRLGAPKGSQQGGGGRDRGERIMLARHMAQQAREVQRGGDGGLLQDQGWKAAVIGPIGLSRQSVGEGVRGSASVNGCIVGACQVEITQGEITRMHPGLPGGQQTGGFAEGEAGDNSFPDRLGCGLCPGVEPGQRLLCGTEGSQKRGERNSKPSVDANGAGSGFVRAGEGRVGFIWEIVPDGLKPGICLGVRLREEEGGKDTKLTSYNTAHFCPLLYKRYKIGTSL